MLLTHLLIYYYFLTFFLLIITNSIYHTFHLIRLTHYFTINSNVQEKRWIKRIGM